MTASHPLRLYRQQTGIKLRELAKAVDRSMASVSRVETGVQKPSPEFAKAISLYTRIPLWQLRPDIWTPEAMQRPDEGAAA
jgi:transcriptional regulator with XRE-family HTH domain